MIGALAGQAAQCLFDKQHQQRNDLLRQQGGLLSQQQAAVRTYSDEALYRIIQSQYKDVHNKTPKELTFRQELQKETDEWLRKI